MSRIFISYRRADAAGDAGRLADHLNRRFGPSRVFLDIDSIDPGTDFERALTSSLAETAAVLVVIGPRWTSLAKPDGSRRLDDPGDYVRREVETALGRGIPVVPVLVQGGTLPRREDLPPSLAALVKRQAASLDHAEFHDDAERLCDRLEKMIGVENAPAPGVARRWWLVAAVVASLGLGVVVYQAIDRGRVTTGADRNSDTTPGTAGPVDALLREAAEQRRRDQLIDALATLARARALAPESDAVLRAQEDVAMEWIRNASVESGKTSYAEAIKPALTVIDAALAAATGPRKADLQSHSGWAAFLLWRDGNRKLDPAGWYRDALGIDPSNPYANAMLAHWTLFRGDDVGKAVGLFETALQSGRAKAAVRQLQWAAFNNSRTPESNRELVRLADAERRDGERLTAREAQRLWAPYYHALGPDRETDRRLLLEALPVDDHIRTLEWAFEEYAAGDESRTLTIRYYVALLHQQGGRTAEALERLTGLAKELAAHPGLLQDAVQASLRRLRR